MTPEEIIKVLREVDADAKASEGDYYADQFAWHGAGEIAGAVEQMAEEIARLREERRSISTLLQKVESLEADRVVPVEEREPQKESLAFPTQSDFFDRVITDAKNERRKMPFLFGKPATELSKKELLAFAIILSGPVDSYATKEQ